MNYPIINNEIPPMASIHEYHIVTSLGRVSCVFEDRILAEKRFKEINNPTWHLVHVERRLSVITPPMATKAALLKEFAEARGLTVIDIQRAKTA
jgi:hypothetical protein